MSRKIICDVCGETVLSEGTMCDRCKKIMSINQPYDLTEAALKADGIDISKMGGYKVLQKR